MKITSKSFTSVFLGVSVSYAYCFCLALDDAKWNWDSFAIGFAILLFLMLIISMVINNKKPKKIDNPAPKWMESKMAFFVFALLFVIILSTFGFFFGSYGRAWDWTQYFYCLISFAVITLICSLFRR